MLKKLICIAFGGLLLLFPSLSHAEITVTVTPDRERYFINDEALFTVEVKEDGFYKDVALDLIDASFPDESTWIDLVKEDIGKYVYRTSPLATEGSKVLNVAVYSEDTLQRIIRYAEMIDRAEQQVEQFKITQATVKNDIAKEQLEKSILRTNGTITEYEEQIVIEKSRGSLATASASILVELPPPPTAEELLYKAEAHYAQIYDVTYDAVNEIYINEELVYKDYTKGFVVFPDYYLEINYETEDRLQPISAALVANGQRYMVDYSVGEVFPLVDNNDTADTKFADASYKINVQNFINSNHLEIIDELSDFSQNIYTVEATPKMPGQYSKIRLKIDLTHGAYTEYEEYVENKLRVLNVIKSFYTHDTLVFPAVEENYVFSDRYTTKEIKKYFQIRINTNVLPEIFDPNYIFDGII